MNSATVGQLLGAVVPHAEPAAEVDDTRFPAQPLEEREHPLEREHALVGSRRAASRRARARPPPRGRARARRSISRSEASGARPNFDSSCAVWIERCVTASTPGVRRTSTRRTPAVAAACRLAGCVEDDESVRLRRRAQLLLRLVVAVEDDAARPGCPRRGRRRARRASRRRRRRPPRPAAAAARRWRTPSCRRRRARRAPPRGRRGPGSGSCPRSRRASGVPNSIRQLARAQTAQRQLAVSISAVSGRSSSTLLVSGSQCRSCFLPSPGRHARPRCASLPTASLRRGFFVPEDVFPDDTEIRAPRDRDEVAARLGGRASLQRPESGSRRTDRREPLVPARDAAVPVGPEPPHGPRPQLHDGRRPDPRAPSQRLARRAADGLGRVRPAGRERCDPRGPASARDDRAEHRDDARPDAAPRLGDRLGARGLGAPADLLPLDAVAVPAVRRARSLLPQGGAGQLVPQRPDGHRQRVRRRRALRALRRRGRARGA